MSTKLEDPVVSAAMRTLQPEQKLSALRWLIEEQITTLNKPEVVLNFMSESLAENAGSHPLLEGIARLPSHVAADLMTPPPASLDLDDVMSQAEMDAEPNSPRKS